MISALSWAPKGVARAQPVFFEPTEEEVKNWKADADEKGVNALDLDAALDGNDSDDSGSDLDETAIEKAQKAAKAMAKGDPNAQVAEFNMDAYDDEPDIDIGSAIMDGAGLAMYDDNAQDPYITKKEDDNEEDEDDIVIRPTDAVLVSVKHEEDMSSLEINIYDEKEQVIYCHHDIMLPAFPLCVSWLDFNASNPGTAGHYAAVGMMAPGIEIWDLDIMDVMEPLCILGGEDYEASKAAAEAAKAAGATVGGSNKKKKNKKKKSAGAAALDQTNVPLKPGSHVDAILGLAWNPRQRNVLASASADNTVKLWDLTNAGCVGTMTHHTDKVQALDWHPTEATVLLTGSFDRNVCLVDVRTQGSASATRVDCDIECVLWNPLSPQYFAVSTESGTITYHDARNISAQPLFTVGAHSKSCSGLSFNPVIPDCLVSASQDKTVKVWDVAGGKPTCVASKAVNIGAIFCCSWYKDLPFVMAAGGAKASLCVWDTSENKAVRDTFCPRVDESLAAAAAAGAVDGEMGDLVESMTLEDGASGAGAGGAGGSARSGGPKKKGVKVGGGKRR